MPANKYRRGARLAAVAAIALIPAACRAHATTASPSPSTSPSASASATVRPAASASGPMTGEEFVWLAGIHTLHENMDKILTDAPQPVTTRSMKGLGAQFAGCTAALTGLGTPTDRLQPVYDLAKRGCAQYEKAGACFTLASKLGTTIAGSADDKKQRQATDCGFSAPGGGSLLFADAESKGFDISQAAH